MATIRNSALRLVGTILSYELFHENLQPILSSRRVRNVLLTTMLLFVSCNQPKQPHAAYVPISQLEPSYGQLITVSNAPTQDQHGTGDRLGLFRDIGGTVWGIPITIADNGDLLGCAPPLLREFAVTDTLPADAVDIIGEVNQPSGWRGGTGKLELLVRDAQGALRLHPVAAAEVKTGPVCWSQSPLEQPLKYYRLIKANAVK
jgi:hypothetical protein